MVGDKLSYCIIDVVCAHVALILFSIGKAKHDRRGRCVYLLEQSGRSGKLSGPGPPFYRPGDWGRCSLVSEEVITGFALRLDIDGFLDPRLGRRLLPSGLRCIDRGATHRKSEDRLAAEPAVEVVARQQWPLLQRASFP